MKDKKIVQILNAGGVGILPTDTIYGLVGSALLPETVERIYRLRKRNKNKPMIVLIGSLTDLKLFGVKLGARESKLLRKYWPGKLSVVFPVAGEKFVYLHCGARSLAFRLPAKISLRKLIEKTGPLVAPSANLEGKPAVKTVSEAKKCFGGRVDFYSDGGRKEGAASTLIKFEKGKPVILREGSVKYNLTK